MSTRFKFKFSQSICMAVLVLAGAAAHAAGTPHTITVKSAPSAIAKWAVYADLYDAHGNKVYHWQETNKKPGSSLTWNYTDGHDGGWMHIWVWPSPSQTYSFLTLPLNVDKCYQITEPMFIGFSKVVPC